MITSTNILIPLIKTSLEDYYGEEFSFLKYVHNNKFNLLKCFIIKDKESNNYYIYDEFHKIKVFFERKNFENYIDEFPSNFLDDINSCMILITKFKLDLSYNISFSQIRTFEFVILIYDFILDKSQKRFRDVSLIQKDVNEAVEVKLLKQFFIKDMINIKLRNSICRGNEAFSKNDYEVNEFINSNVEAFNGYYQNNNKNVLDIYNTPTIRNMGYGVFRLSLVNDILPIKEEKERDDSNKNQVNTNRKGKGKKNNKKSNNHAKSNGNCNDDKDNNNDQVDNNATTSRLEKDRLFLFNNNDDIIIETNTIKLIEYDETDERIADEHFNIYDIEMNDFISEYRNTKSIDKGDSENLEEIKIDCLDCLDFQLKENIDSNEYKDINNELSKLADEEESKDKNDKGESNLNDELSSTSDIELSTESSIDNNNTNIKCKDPYSKIKNMLLNRKIKNTNINKPNINDTNYNGLTKYFDFSILDKIKNKEILKRKKLVKMFDLNKEISLTQEIKKYLIKRCKSKRKGKSQIVNKKSLEKLLNSSGLKININEILPLFPENVNEENKNDNNELSLKETEFKTPTKTKIPGNINTANITSITNNNITNSNFNRSRERSMKKRINFNTNVTNNSTHSESKYTLEDFLKIEKYLDMNLDYLLSNLEDTMV